MDTWLVVFVLGNLGFFGLMITLAVFYRLQKDRQRSDERMRVLDRFATADELEQFLTSPAGQHLFDRLAPPPTDPRRTIVVALGIGFVTLMVGVGLCWLTFGDGDFEELAVGAIVLLCTGFGTLIAGAASLALTRRWGLFHRPDDE